MKFKCCKGGGQEKKGNIFIICPQTRTFTDHSVKDIKVENNIHTHTEVVFSAIATLSACWLPSLFCLLSLNEYGVGVEGRNPIPIELSSLT